MIDYLKSEAAKIDIAITNTQAQQLLDYLNLIIKWNKVYNLTAIKSLEDGINKHLLDSLSILPHINNKNLLDIGSGAGLPGIAIAIMRPNLNVSVLDSVGKKCRFMQFVKTHLRLDNLVVINARVQDFNNQNCFAQITSRAFATIEKTLFLSKHLLCDDGVYLLMKTTSVNQEKIPKDTKTHKLNSPNVLGNRYLIEITKS